MRKPSSSEELHKCLQGAEDSFFEAEGASDRNVEAVLA
jgi:hypothetical protein